MSDLVLARHGETVWHTENRYAGRTDVALSPTGHAQAEQLGRWAAAAGVEAVWSSTLSRARDTAAAASRAAGLDLREDARLCELDFGDAEGLTVAEMELRFPGATRAFQTDPVEHHLPGGEDPRRAVERSLAALREIAAERESGRVLVVFHTTLIRLTVCRILGVPLGDYRRLFPFLRNCAITEVRLDGERGALLEFNTPVDGVDGAAPSTLEGRAQARPSDSLSTRRAYREHTTD